MIVAAKTHRPAVVIVTPRSTSRTVCDNSANYFLLFYFVCYKYFLTAHRMSRVSELAGLAVILPIVGRQWKPPRGSPFELPCT
jgi:hypothetical protein